MPGHHARAVGLLLSVVAQTPGPASPCIAAHRWWCAQGAFATVERAWYTPEQGARQEVAVKRLKPAIFDCPEDFE